MKVVFKTTPFDNSCDAVACGSEGREHSNIKKFRFLMDEISHVFCAAYIIGQI